jgi:predicted nucleic acid-binding Zn ribbon protein
MRRRKGSSSPRLIGDILPETLRKKSIHLPMKDRPLIEAWNRAVGPQIGAKAQPDRIRDDVLYVRVSTSVWMHELQFMKQDIIEKLNGVLGATAVSQIRFFIGNVEAPPAKPSAQSVSFDAADLKADERDYIHCTLAGIADPELREILRETMSRSILRGRKSR